MDEIIKELLLTIEQQQADIDALKTQQTQLTKAIFDQTQETESLRAANNTVVQVLDTLFDKEPSTLPATFPMKLG
jgi:hypothetical protein